MNVVKPGAILQHEWKELDPRVQGGINLVTAFPVHLSVAVSHVVSSAVNLLSFYHLWGEKTDLRLKEKKDIRPLHFIGGMVKEMINIIGSPLCVAALTINAIVITIFGDKVSNLDPRKFYLYLEAILYAGPGAMYQHKEINKQKSHRPDHYLLFRGSTFHTISKSDTIFRKELEPRIKGAIDCIASTYMMVPLVIGNIIESFTNIAVISLSYFLQKKEIDNDCKKELQREALNMVASPLFYLAYKLTALAMAIIGSEFQGYYLADILRHCEEGLKGKPGYILSNYAKYEDFSPEHDRIFMGTYRLEQHFPKASRGLPIESSFPGHEEGFGNSMHIPLKEVSPVEENHDSDHSNGSNGYIQVEDLGENQNKNGSPLEKVDPSNVAETFQEVYSDER